MNLALSLNHGSEKDSNLRKTVEKRTTSWKEHINKVIRSKSDDDISILSINEMFMDEWHVMTIKVENSSKSKKTKKDLHNDKIFSRPQPQAITGQPRSCLPPRYYLYKNG